MQKGSNFNQLLKQINQEALSSSIVQIPEMLP